MGNLRASERTLRARSAGVYVLVNPESAVCVPAAVTCCLCQPQGRRGLGCLCPVCGCCCKQRLVCGRLCGRLYQCPPWVSLAQVLSFVTG